MRVLTLLCLVFFVSFVKAESIKIGYLDTQKVLISLTQYQTEILNISKEFEPKKQELLDLFEYIELLRGNLNSLEISSTTEAFQIELNKIVDLEASFNRETEYLQQYIDKKNIDLLKKMELIINTAINEIAISEDYDLILYENIAFVSNEIDITEKIILNIESQTL